MLDLVARGDPPPQLSLDLSQVPIEPAPRAHGLLPYRVQLREPVLGGLPRVRGSRRPGGFVLRLGAVQGFLVAYEGIIEGVIYRKERDLKMGVERKVIIEHKGDHYLMIFVRDENGFAGGPRISRPHVEWDSPVRAVARSLRGEWIARLDLPLDFIANALGEAQPPHEWRVLLMRRRPGRSGEPQETSVLPVTQSVTPFTVLMIVPP